MKQLILILILLFFGSCYQELNTNTLIQNFYETHSHYPIFHMYYNRHFSNSRQYQDFLDVLEQTQYRNRDYSRYILTDCEKAKNQNLQACQRIFKNKDNRIVLGFYPSSQFINYGGKMMQNPPFNRVWDHPSDRYSVSEIQNFIYEMMPNFYKELVNLEQFEEFKKPLYSPKLIFLSRQEEIPISLIRNSINYFLKFDFAFVSDLTENIVNVLNVTKFPTLLVLKYNFTSQKHQKFIYENVDLSAGQYDEIKEFLGHFALSQPRNDYLFHKIQMPERKNIIIVDSKADLTENLDKSSGWVMISESNGQSTKIKQLQQKYGKFVEYIHFINKQSEAETIHLFDPDKHKLFQLSNDQIHFKSLNKNDFISNLTFWATKNFVVMGVREKYGHICTVSVSILFRSLTQCVIVKEQDRQEVEKQIGINIDIGFVISEKKVNGTIKISGQPFKQNSFEDIYLTVEYLTRLKSKQVIQDFMDAPIKKIKGKNTLQSLCMFPTKKCALVFTDSNKKDKTTKQYLQEIAVNFINEYQFYQIDINCNPHFLTEIEALKKNSGGLVVFHPKTSIYVYLKAKISKTTLQKFLKINLSENKKLPDTKFSSTTLEINECIQSNTDL